MSEVSLEAFMVLQWLNEIWSFNLEGHLLPGSPLVYNYQLTRVEIKERFGHCMKTINEFVL